MKSMARLKSEPTFAALFSLVNEWEEIRAQAMALTKGFSILPEMFKQVSNGLQEHGHQATALYFCDNPPAKRDFHKRVTQSLKHGVQHIAVDPWRDLPVFMSSTAAEFFDNTMLINNACEEILESVRSASSSERMMIALTISQLPDSGMLETIQMRTLEKILVFKVTGLTPDTVPPCLQALLTSSRIIKTGHDISHSVIAIAAAFGMPELDTLFRQFDSPFLDLGKLAKVKGAVRDLHVPLSSLVPAVLKKRYPDSPSLPSLSSESQKIKFLALEVGNTWFVQGSHGSIVTFGVISLHLRNLNVISSSCLIASKTLSAVMTEKKDEADSSQKSLTRWPTHYWILFAVVSFQIHLEFHYTISSDGTATSYLCTEQSAEQTLLKVESTCSFVEFSALLEPLLS
ncbi:hypothetical protein F5880DRAFT_845532 [Lentinula raphanica]|nr:hypothetical protein F5880DRAFT_845532 [Lentinula raphanica]